MNQEIKDKLLWRATIIENSESLIRSCSRNDKAQLSLFEETKHETITLEIPEINPEDWVRKESDVLGVSLTYNIQDRYILHSKRFCNSTLRSINELTESGDKLIFIARIDEIEYRKSLAGNNYARINWKDYFMTYAAAASLRSSCVRRKYGAIIVKYILDNLIIFRDDFLNIKIVALHQGFQLI